MNQSTSSSDPSGAIERHVWLTAMVVVAGSLMGIIATTIVNVAINHLSADLHSPLADIQWVSTGYLLGMAAVIPAAGWAAQRFGGKRLYLVSLGAFVVASLLCAIAWSATALIAFRVLQGFAGGMTMPIGQMMLASAAGPQRMGRLMSVVGVPMILGPVFGPVLGGFIVDNLSWHWLFVVNIPFGIAAIALGLRFLPESRPQQADRLDVRGFLLLCSGVPLLIFGLSKTNQAGGFGSSTVVVPLLIGAALIALFAAHAWRAATPLLDIRLLRNRGFAAATLGTFCTGAALFGGMLLLPLYLQIVRGEDALHAALLLIPQGIGTALLMPLTGRLTDRVGGGRVAAVGIVAMTVATIPLAHIGATTSYWVLSAILVMRGMAMGAAMMPMMAAAYATLRPTDIPHATPQLNVMQRIGGSIGMAVLTVVLTHHMTAAIPGVHGGMSAVSGAPMPPGVIEALAGAFGTAYWWAAGATALAIIPALALARIESRDRAAVAHERAAVHGTELDEVDAQLAPA